MCDNKVKIHTTCLHSTHVCHVEDHICLSVHGLDLESQNQMIYFHNHLHINSQEKPLLKQHSSQEMFLFPLELYITPQYTELRHSKLIVRM